MSAPIDFPPKLRFLFQPKRYKILHGGRGGAKSWGVARALLVMGSTRPLRVLCAREFQKSIKDSVHQLLKDQIALLGLQDFYTVTNTSVIGKNGTQFGFEGLHHNTANIKSWEGADIAWIEEAHVVSKNSWDILIPTIRKEGSEIWVTFNPELETDETYQRFVVSPPPDSTVCQINWSDNPWFPDVLRAEKDYLKGKDLAAYQNVWEGHCKAAIEGAIYAEALNKARNEQRIGEFPYDDRYPVSCFWDIGWNDHTSIVFLQFVNHEPRIIYAYQNQFKKTPHYIQELNERKYVYDRIVLPHDAENEHGDAEKTWLQQVRQAFPNSNVYAGKRRAVELRLEAVKNVFDVLRFHKATTVDLISALAHYHFAVDPQTNRQTREPFHGPESNYADAFGYMCLEMRPPAAKQKPPRERPSIIRRSGFRR